MDSITSDFRTFVLSYALDVPQDSGAVCRVYVRKAGERRPAEAEVRRIAEQVAAYVRLAD